MYPLGGNADRRSRFIVPVDKKRWAAPYIRNSPALGLCCVFTVKKSLLSGAYFSFSTAL